ncbi:MAG TPA: hypothetical protein VFU21_15855, partial [Kofleriaceae bacterium]|nr:hypothetical protein [Kofleriaceae bacterium]
DAGLRAALAGERHAGQLEAGRRSLEAARAAFGKPDCPAAEREAAAALLPLAAAQAAGAEVTGELRQAYVFLLLCADQRADAASARAAAGNLRALGGPEPPEGVGEPVWSRYPAVDVTAGARHVQLDVTTQPPGAAVWIDHAPVGVSPVSRAVTEGDHLVAAAAPAGGAAAVRAASGPIALAIPRERAPWRNLEARVRAWQSRAARRDRRGLATVLSSARLAYAVVIDERGRFTVWQRRGLAVRQLGVAPDGLGIGALVQAAEQRRTQAGMDPDQPLMRETPEERAAYLAQKKGKGPSKQEWWVYAALIGAVAIGAGVVLANDLADDHQSFEITFP